MINQTETQTYSRLLESQRDLAEMLRDATNDDERAYLRQLIKATRAEVNNRRHAIK